METNIRLLGRLANYSLALSQLEATVLLARQRPLRELEQQGLIQSFEYTHELSWNVLRDYLKDQGTQQLHGAKDTVRAACAVGLIGDGETWMEMIRDRNHSSHTYNLDIATAIVHRIIDSYILESQELQRTCDELANEVEGT